MLLSVVLLLMPFISLLGLFLNGENFKQRWGGMIAQLFQRFQMINMSAQSFK